jgi:hypothetical protein
LEKKEDDTKEVGLTTVKPPSHSLELNLMVVFIYMASRSFGIIEKDVLMAA